MLLIQQDIGPGPGKSSGGIRDADHGGGGTLRKDLVTGCRNDFSDERYSRQRRQRGGDDVEAPPGKNEQDRA